MTPEIANAANLPAPPSWAQWLLSSIVPGATEESVSGDLLEQYRETVHPADGRWVADAWFVRQVAGFLWRSAWMFIALTAASGILRSLADTFAPPSPGPGAHQLRSMITTYAAIGTFVLAGMYGGYRTGRAIGGGLTAAAAAAAGQALGLAFDVVLFYVAIRPDPARLNLFYATGGWGEAVGFLLILPAVAAALGSIGGACGKTLRAAPGRRTTG